MGGKKEINVVLKEESHALNEVVVTAMGILRKEKSLTYATQQIKSDDPNRVQDPNVAKTLSKEKFRESLLLRVPVAPEELRKLFFAVTSRFSFDPYCDVDCRRWCSHDQ